MKFKGLVLYRDAFAHYSITKEGEGIFSAVLERYDGNLHDLPPPNVVLTKSVRNWKGSSDEQPLIDELGEMIECNLESGLYLFNNNNEDPELKIE
jgi:hypothetical protein